MNPTSLARKCLIDCEGDREKAVAAMHAALTPEMTSDLVAAGVRYHIRIVTSAIRHELEAGAICSLTTSRRTPRASTATIERTGQVNWYHYNLPGGQTTLGAATKDDLYAAIAYYRTEARRYDARGDFLDDIAKGMRKATVRQSYSEKKLAELAASRHLSPEEIAA